MHLHRASFVVVVGLLVGTPVAPADDQANPPSTPASSETPRPAEPTKPADNPPAAETAEKTKAKPEARTGPQLATFAGGCFWSMEAVFEHVPGVLDVVSGFSGGNVPGPTYEMVGTGTTGHAESVQIMFDPTVVSYGTLLKVFWSAHDPTTLNSQGDDFGPQYRSMIFYRDAKQKEAALKSYEELKARRVLRAPVVTELVPFRAFYPAELYHQDYYRNHPDGPYAQIYIEPKLKKLHLSGVPKARSKRTAAARKKAAARGSSVPKPVSEPPRP